MKILVLNCGSSSVKYKLFEIETKTILAQGGVEKNRIERLVPEIHVARRREENSGNRYARTSFGNPEHSECADQC